ncbi:MAG TPA: aromatic-ring-hydroxylating dioxygenase subunit beta [Stellaceae bacterium]|nr:aromatic-ring-hydroxylating dioxygenase subunit beta [Stellaceae bacterium]
MRSEIDLRALDLRVIEQFLYREALLLDEKRWQEWLALYTADCFYWVPSVVGQNDPVDTVSLYAEDRMRMEMRIIRITHPHAWSQDFPTRMSHVVGNVMRDPDGGKGADGGINPRADLVVRSTVHILEHRKEEQRLFGGNVRHWLRREDGELKIAMKRIDLINCDAPMEVVQLFL